MSEQKRTGRLDPRMVRRQMPIGGQHVWDWFWELDAGRGYNSVGGLSNITHVQIAAWASLTGMTVRRHELEVIMAMDRVRLKCSVPGYFADRYTADQAMTPALFRAMFNRGARPADGSAPGAKELFSDLKRMAVKNGTSTHEGSAAGAG